VRASFVSRAGENQVPRGLQRLLRKADVDFAEFFVSLDFLLLFDQAKSRVRPFAVFYKT
jgi:hypothetical protein